MTERPPDEAFCEARGQSKLHVVNFPKDDRPVAGPAMCRYCRMPLTRLYRWTGSTTVIQAYWLGPPIFEEPP